MKEAFEKIIKKLIDMKIIRGEQCHEDYELEIITERDFDDAIEIVNQVAEEYRDIDRVTAFGSALRMVDELEKEYGNDGWIPCSERLPEIEGCTSDTVLVCGSNGFQYMAFWCDDLQWRFCECGMAKEPVLWTEIIAWQPLPEPYKPKGE